MLAPERKMSCGQFAESKHSVKNRPACKIMLSTCNRRAHASTKSMNSATIHDEVDLDQLVLKDRDIDPGRPGDRSSLRDANDQHLSEAIDVAGHSLNNLSASP